MKPHSARYRLMKLGFLSALVSVFISISSYAGEAVDEKWIGHYMYQGSDIKFPLHIEISIKDGKANGVAFDGSMEEATVTGTVKDGAYDLLLHPIKHGSNASQDVYYKGNRSGNTITGRWVHVVGVTGPWVSTITSLSPKEAIEKYKLPCEMTEVSSVRGCGNDA